MFSFKKFLGVKGKGDPVKKTNEVESIKEYPDEAQRQVHLFYDNIHRKDWNDTNYEGEEPAQDTGKRDAFLAKHGLKKLPSTAPETNPHQVATHLDHYHHFYPDIAKRFNMTPLNTTEDKIAAVKSTLSNSLSTVKRSIQNIGKPQVKSEPLEIKFDKSDVNKQNPMIHIKPGSDLHNMIHSVHQTYKKDVETFHKANPDLHHLSGGAVYGHFAHDFSYQHGMRSPMSNKHWDAINKK